MNAAAARAAAPAAPAALPRGVARALGFSALAAFGALHWAALLAPSPAGGLALAVGTATAAGLALGRPAGRRSRLRAALAVPGAACLVVATLVAAGLPGRLAVPWNWGVLASGVGDGVSALPDAVVPYAGPDPWIRLVILCGGGLLVALAALAVFWPAPYGPRRRAAAFAALAVLYAVPAVERSWDSPSLRGVAFAVLAIAFLHLERIRRLDAALAATLTAAAALAGAAASTALDRSRPLVDYESLARALAPSAGERFDWDHRYGPLDWPRDGRVVLRVAARRPAYWKARNLDEFDGLRWRTSGLLGSPPDDSEVPDSAVRAHPRWLQTIRVTLGGMASHDLIAAGSTLAVLHPPRAPLPAGGTFAVDGTLRHGDSYLARVYTPRPSRARLAAVRSVVDTTGYLDAYTSLELPTSGGRAVPADRLRQVVVPPFGTGGEPLANLGGSVDRGGAALLRASPYAREYALSRRLAAGARGPYYYVRRVERFLGRMRYSETPPRRRFPLDAFLFRDRVGYCQQFSGAMALLLRLGGVPARVATGFTTGSYDAGRREWDVRDFDAHSWVEAYFPRIGWVPFDPTPLSAPARSRSRPAGSAAGAGGRGGRGGEHAGERPAPGGQRAGGGPPVVLLGALVLLGLALAAATTGAIARRGRAAERDPLLAELERALRRSGRRLAPATTLATLRRRFRDSPGAAGYVAAVETARFAGAGAGPTAAQRRALRRELAAGLGVVGRLRALWALPPARPAPGPPPGPPPVTGP